MVTGMTPADPAIMGRAIALATAQQGQTAPNPSVGCVIVCEGKIIAEAATGEGGRPHAEEAALARAGKAATNSDVYVTLEPCFRRSIGGISCTEHLIAAGVARVIYASHDPSPFANHKGPEALKAAGIVVEAGLGADGAEPLIAASRLWYATGLPLIGESPDGAGYDRAFDPDGLKDVQAEARAAASEGPVRLWVPAGSALADAVRAAGLILGIDTDVAHQPPV